jgi:hypothetical protein
MYPRNAASPPRIAVGAVVKISDGSVQSSGVSIAIRPEGGSEAAGSGTISYGSLSNIVYYAPLQTETDYTAFVVSAYSSGCIPISATIPTDAGDSYSALKTEIISDLSQGLPPATPTIEEAIMYIYSALRNKGVADSDADEKQFYNDSGVMIWKKAITKTSTSYTEAEGVSGP